MVSPFAMGSVIVQQNCLLVLIEGLIGAKECPILISLDLAAKNTINTLPGIIMGVHHLFYKGKRSSKRPCSSMMIPNTLKTEQNLPGSSTCHTPRLPYTGLQCKLIG